ncbi:MAG TPA: hypothetical protein VJN64_17160 [Terriglobales bacterium]|nr:hypothetical protein [Terriglobales bacterium]
MRCSLKILPALFLACSLLLQAQEWRPAGPEGGSVRSLAYDPSNPDRIFLGTSSGRLYLSTNGGATWSRSAHLGSGSELVLDHVLIDPVDSRNIYVAGWNAQSPYSDGDLFRSNDGGKTWDLLPGMHGKSIRALALAPSDHKLLVAGALDGIFRSRDGGDTWERISPAHHAEIRQIESVAIDPADSNIIYAGTWHLPWKTNDGGKTWHNIKKGVIDDSDVFSIVIDQKTPANIYISACSGIYKSESSGELFRKIQGIPYSARRTRMLKVDPADHNVIYAGTTEGLWKSTDAGATWKRTTTANIVINDVLIDPRQPARVLLATDRGGVLASNDGGLTFASSNYGFTHRQVAALLVDRNDKSTIYAGLLNDKEQGGVFVSRDAARSWTQMSAGLDERDVFVLRQSPEGILFAGTDRGILRFDAGQNRWIPLNPPAPALESVSSKRKRTQPQASSDPINGRILDLELTPQRWYAATADGLLTSSNHGESWHSEEAPQLKAAENIAAAGSMLAVAGRNNVTVTLNGGESWLAAKPLNTIINSIAIDPRGAGALWVGARDGIYRSTDLGDTWTRINSLRLSNVASVEVDAENQRVLAIGAGSKNIYETRDNGRTWSAINSGWLLRSVYLAGDRLLATTPFDGVILQPEALAGPATEAADGGNR